MIVRKATQFHKDTMSRIMHGCIWHIIRAGLVIHCYPFLGLQDFSPRRTWRSG